MANNPGTREQIVVFTAIFGGFDELKPALSPGHFVAFVDGDEEADGWEIHRFPKSADPRRAARKVKILSHWLFPRSEVTIWIDGNAQLRVPPEVLVEEWLSQADLATFEHPWRHCAYDEAKKIVYYQLDDPELVKKQVLVYAKDGFPTEQGLGETRVVVRRHTPQIRKFNEFWWKQVEKYSARDQVSFPYAAWKTGVRWAAVPMVISRWHPYFDIGGHKHEEGISIGLPVDRG